jgi:hypothetical protein
VITAIVLAAAALAVGIVSLAKPASSDTRAAPDAAKSASAPASGDTKDADLALCTAIAPLMAESDQLSKAYVGTGAPATPGRDAATPKFITDVQDWVRRIQPIVDQNPEVDPFFKRSLQRFIDDWHLFVIDLGPGELTSYAKTLWADSTGAYSGPLHICDGLGVKW